MKAWVLTDEQDLGRCQLLKLEAKMKVMKLTSGHPSQCEMWVEKQFSLSSVRSGSNIRTWVINTRLQLFPPAVTAAPSFSISQHDEQNWRWASVKSWLKYSNNNNQKNSSTDSFPILGWFSLYPIRMSALLVILTEDASNICCQSIASIIALQ